jgi:hypothetical protein
MIDKCSCGATCSQVETLQAEIDSAQNRKLAPEASNIPFG